MHNRPNCLTIGKTINIGETQYLSLPVAMEASFKAIICQSQCFIALEPDIRQKIAKQAKTCLGVTIEELRNDHYLTVGCFTQFAKDSGTLEVEIRSRYTDHVRLRLNWLKEFSPAALKCIEYNEKNNQ